MGTATDRAPFTLTARLPKVACRPKHAESARGNNFDEIRQHGPKTMRGTRRFRNGSIRDADETGSSSCDVGYGPLDCRVA